MSKISQLQSQLEEIVARFPEQITKLSEATLLNKPSADKWSKIEILGHLVDSALNNYQRWIRILQGTPLTLNYNQDKWVKLGDYQHTPVSEVLNLWILVNKQSIRLMGNISSIDAGLLYNDGQKEVTLAHLIEDYIGHLHHHIRQIL